MSEYDRCGLPYVHNGDIRECRLDYNHDGDCPQANRAAFLDSLEQRARDALREGWVF